MTLAPGSRLGSYEILSPLGSGGMGEVYRARDARLGREVAVKVLPEEFFEDKERVTRFEREAKLLAALNHPNIAAIHSFEEVSGSPGSPGSSRRHLLVMELVAGETLRERLGEGPLPVREVLDVAVQLAKGLGAAHGRGIVHRDLKPENIVLSRDGRVRILDFGLAKPLPQDAAGDDPTSAGTRSLLTQAGTVMGTASYMSPEQVFGEPVDGRSDIFTFGTILYEMLSGTNPFRSATSAESMTAILRHEPPRLSEPPFAVAPPLSEIVARCLDKRPENRFQSAEDLAFALQMSSGASPSAASVRGRRPSRRVVRAAAGACAAGLVLGASAVLLLRSPSRVIAPAKSYRFTIPPPENGSFAFDVESTSLAFSPDGSQLAYIASDPKGGTRVWLRALSAFEAAPLAGTEGATSVFWSPGGSSIGFFDANELKRLDLPGGAPVSICEVTAGSAKSGTWGRGGDILFASAQGDAVYGVSASGGTPRAILKPDASVGETRVVWPWFLPDGVKFLYYARVVGGGRVMLKEPGRPPRLVLAAASMVQYSDPGYLVFVKDGVLLGQPFDARSGRLSGRPFSIADHVRYFMSTAAGSFATSRGGALAFQPRGDVDRLVWFDRTGRELGTIGKPAEYLGVRIPADGRPVLFDRARADLGTFDVWSYDVERNVETRVTSSPDSEFAAIWLPGGTSVLFSAVRGSSPRLVRRDLATETEKELLPRGGFQSVGDISPDGRTLVYFERSDTSPFAMWALPLSGEGEPRLLLKGSSLWDDARFSPDGRFLAFISGESGQPEAYVMPFPGPGEKTRVSTGGARVVRWSRDGHALFYLTGDRHMASVPVRTTPSLQLGAPKPLFELKGRLGWIAFDVSPDGKRFLAVVPETLGDELPLSVVVDWPSDVEK